VTENFISVNALDEVAKCAASGKLNVVDMPGADERIWRNLRHHLLAKEDRRAMMKSLQQVYDRGDEDKMTDSYYGGGY